MYFQIYSKRSHKIVKKITKNKGNRCQRNSCLVALCNHLFPAHYILHFIPLLTTKKNTKNTEKSTEFWGSWYSTWTSWNFTQASILTVFQESRIENWGSKINFWGPVNLLLSGTVHLIDHRQEPLKMHALLRLFYK